MTAALTTVASWRRILLVALTALIAALAISFSAPSDANAFVDSSAVFASTKGWVLVRSTPVACPAIYPSTCATGGTATAWRWANGAWSQTRIAGGTQVYAWPYTGSWHWIWTQPTGWLAIQTSTLDSGNRCPVGAYC